MDKSDQYRRFARECLELARTALSEQSRQVADLDLPFQEDLEVALGPAQQATRGAGTARS
jgi:hypothetical protein